ncbi:hypothetical protein CRG98_000561 [Punica granatum]|uniref:Uncharacterized protein n=1 Tax=Punica granatum TaxID=22663 RepID=A0A2I0LEJ9_PUNGR|nr:hypothetical protein CRG98_000561 [Punica granatum]
MAKTKAFCFLYEILGIEGRGTAFYDLQTTSGTDKLTQTQELPQSLCLPLSNPHLIRLLTSLAFSTVLEIEVKLESSRKEKPMATINEDDDVVELDGYEIKDTATRTHAGISKELSDSNYTNCPASLEWEKIEKIKKFFEAFYEIINLFSGKLDDYDDDEYSTSSKKSKLEKEKREKGLGLPVGNPDPITEVVDTNKGRQKPQGWSWGRRLMASALESTDISNSRFRSIGGRGHQSAIPDPTSMVANILCGCMLPQWWGRGRRPTASAPFPFFFF